MPHFYHQSENILISTNYKVLYSFLRRQEKRSGLLYISEKHLLGFKKTQAKNADHVLLVRNPYARIMSFYKDKFHQHPAAETLTYGDLQRCQRIFITELYPDISDDTPADDINRALTSVSFSDFVETLPKVYQLDGHLYPQHQIALFRHRYLRFRHTRLDFSHTFKIETDLELFSNLTGLNTSDKVNSTKSVSLKIEWDDNSRKTIQDIYRQDFEDYHYDTQAV